MKITSGSKTPNRPELPYLARHTNGCNYLVIRDGAINVDRGSTGTIVTFNSGFKEENMTPYVGPLTVENDLPR